MYRSTLQPNPRIQVADVLRGIAILGILLVHSIEHYNLYFFPEPDTEFLRFLNQATFNGLFQFLLAGKMYAIFALLFGLSFFIQLDNQEQKGADFRPRFAWRMCLLFCFGLLNSVFYSGDVLCMYAVCGLLLLPFVKLNNKTLCILGIIMALQPVEIYYAVSALINPAWEMPATLSGALYGKSMAVQASGTLWEVIKSNLTSGIAAGNMWSIEHGRITQTLSLFIFGMLMGRKRLFYNENNHLKTWLVMLIVALFVYFPLYGLQNVLGDYITNPNLRQPLSTILGMWANLAFMVMMVASIVLLFYATKAQGFLNRLTPYGKMSLTHYIGQGIIGSFIFNRWGLDMAHQCGAFWSLVIGLGIFALQYAFSILWSRHHSRGPLEGLWRTLTWIGKK